MSVCVCVCASMLLHLLCAYTWFDPLFSFDSLVIMAHNARRSERKAIILRSAGASHRMGSGGTTERTRPTDQPTDLVRDRRME